MASLNLINSYRSVYPFRNLSSTAASGNAYRNELKAKNQKSEKYKEWADSHKDLDGEQKPSESLAIMLHDEKIQPVMRLFNQETKFMEELINVYKFYFNDVKPNLKQRTRTMHLALAYFTQTVMRWPCLQKSEIGIIAASAFLCASKFDEIDYNLPSIRKVRSEMMRSKHFIQYDTDFANNNFVSCEKEIWKRLNWNFNQLTSFDFFEWLTKIGIVFKSDKIKSTTSPAKQSQYSHQTSATSEYNKRALRANSDWRYEQSSNQRSSSHSREISNRRTNPLRNTSNSRNVYWKQMKRTSSRFATVRSSLANNQLFTKEKLYELCEYLLSLSLLIMELQSYSASKVASACIMTSRKIMKLEQIWPNKLRTITSYCEADLERISVILLKNYNTLWVGNSKIRVSETLGVQPVHYNYEVESKLELSSQKPKKVNTESGLEVSKTQISRQSSAVFIQPSPKTRITGGTLRHVYNSVNSWEKESSSKKSKQDSKLDSQITEKLNSSGKYSKRLTNFQNLALKQVRNNMRQGSTHSTSMLSSTNKSFEKKSYLYRKGNLDLSNTKQQESSLIRKFDMRHKSISSPKITELRMRYCKRSTEKSSKNLLPTSKNLQILSRKSNDSKPKFKFTQENELEEIIIPLNENRSKHRYQYREKGRGNLRIAVERKPSDISTGTGQSRSPKTTPFSQITNNVKGEWVYDKYKYEQPKK